MKEAAAKNPDLMNQRDKEIVKRRNVSKLMRKQQD
jgi:hypothetical protein